MTTSMGNQSTGKGIAIYVSFPNSMSWSEQCKTLVVLRKHPRVSRAYSHQVGITGNKRYSADHYPDTEEVMGQADLHIVVERDCGSLGKGSVSEIKHSQHKERPVVFANSDGDFCLYDKEWIKRKEVNYNRWWMNLGECDLNLTEVLNKCFGTENPFGKLKEHDPYEEGDGPDVPWGVMAKVKDHAIQHIQRVGRSMRYENTLETGMELLDKELQKGWDNRLCAPKSTEENEDYYY